MRDGSKSGQELVRYVRFIGILTYRTRCSTLAGWMRNRWMEGASRSCTDEGAECRLRGCEITSQETEERCKSDLVMALSWFLWCCINTSTLGSVGAVGADGCVKCPPMMSESDPRRSSGRESGRAARTSHTLLLKNERMQGFRERGGWSGGEGRSW